MSGEAAAGEAEIEARLAGGGTPLTPEALLARLAELGIAQTTIEHPPVFTVEEAKALRGTLPGAHVKNLFLRNKKGRMWLLSCLEDRDIDLKALGERLGGGRLSFGSAERLMRHLGVRPGSVTALAVVNDPEGAVQLVLDRALTTLDPVNLHPLANDRTTALSPEGLLAFCRAVGHEPALLDMD
ncbi:MAG: prolyl-tRNA synthetase associated domain-containing protein [Tistlia sp.]|uniref:prolyl-tRNA synthetase associated domain-containing protein n=1 Tax=Tistlia sp. TaxID=3057121 RepID=UPI0034A0FF98